MYSILFIFPLQLYVKSFTGCINNFENQLNDRCAPLDMAIRAEINLNCDYSLFQRRDYFVVTVKETRMTVGTDITCSFLRHSTQSQLKGTQ